MKKNQLPVKTLERLILYKRLLSEVQNRGQQTVYSHQIAQLVGNSAVQVRRDLMQIGFSGSSRNGYVIKDLLQAIEKTLNNAYQQKMILLGVGNLGKAILTYFTCQQPLFNLVAAFDNDPNKVNRVIGGCRCFPLEKLDELVKQEQIKLAILTVPAFEAQNLANKLIYLGIKGILNFAPVTLKVPDSVICEQMDIMLQLEKLAFLTQQKDEVNYAKV
ncbi:MAG TPA: redox-sensing transcriptional repressor Rex [Caldithrix abyssi]|uniref:Redox-sensing transcriptional repressor Rex n=1 Tax=Caldithrix abyssi TaxID=187145 RepID=A0A7V5LIW9_CALAY|nr:redox-sensing transcriptional repressor Rex [Caldisericaceae bacterium]HHE54325.1 redox-sensing transcriptional repressor Rex [Caldithrix abyssi]